MLQDIVEWRHPLVSIAAFVAYVAGIWCFDFYFLPLGLTVALLAEPSRKYLGKREKEEEEEQGEEEDGKRRSMVEDSQVWP